MGQEVRKRAITPLHLGLLSLCLVAPDNTGGIVLHLPAIYQSLPQPYPSAWVLTEVFSWLLAIKAHPHRSHASILRAWAKGDFL